VLPVAKLPWERQPVRQATLVRLPLRPGPRPVGLLLGAAAQREFRVPELAANTLRTARRPHRRCRERSWTGTARLVDYGHVDHAHVLSRW